ncbi:MAG: ABC transporter substrate-binding protein [Candidatus Marinimicrobia bacterium]|nr:ABC transporter substrate-binding protein [Candidatus Neomarinimicrobiota bacterium]
MNRKIFIALWYGAMLLLLVSCSKDHRKEREPNTFVFVTYDDVKDWDPGTAFSLEVLPLSNMYELLLWYDATGDEPVFIPGLATSYKQSVDGRRWTFQLRKGVKFHDGEDFNAESVKFVVDRNKSLGRGASYIWNAVREVQIDNTYQVTFLLDEPVPLDRIVSSQYGAWMYSPRIVEIPKDSLRNGYDGGTGPYYLKKWIRNGEIRLEKFDGYWRGWPQQNYFSKVNIRVVSEASTRIQMIKNNQADYVTQIPIQLLSSLQEAHGVKVDILPGWVNHFYLLNTKKYPTNDINVRRAIAAAFDRKTILRYVYKDVATYPVGFIPATVPLASQPDSLIEYDLKYAQYLLNEADLVDNNPEISFSYVSTSEEYHLTSLMLLDNLRKIGIKMHIQPGLWSAIWERAKYIDTAPNIISMAWWPAYASPSDWFYGLYFTQDPPLFNLAHYSNAKVDSLIGVAWKNEALNPERARKIYKEIQNKLIEDCVAIPVADLQIWAVYNENIHGIRGNPAYNTLLFYNLVRSG